MKPTRNQNAAFTLTELVVVIGVITLLAATLLSAQAHTKSQVQRITCSNNLKQLGLAFRTWAAANGGYMPMSVSSAQGGASAEVGIRTVASSQSSSHGVCKMFLCLSNQLSTPKCLFCPAEYETQYRQAATTFAATASYGQVPYTNDLNVSYFVGVDGSESFPRMLLSGDHNLGGNANPPTTAFLSAPSAGTPFVSLGTNFATSAGTAWMDNMHGKLGNAGMADGSVEWFSRSNLQTALKNSGDRAHVAGSFSLATGSTGGAGCNRIQLP
jgi:prepilin-type processing-associated H-X9-DG protein